MASTNMTGNAAAAPPRPSLMEKEKSVTMEYFLETSKLDKDTAALLRKYDKDGNGSFSKDEVVAIILDLRETTDANKSLSQYNKLFKRLLIAACVFCLLLLASMFGLSYAVAALTAKTSVDSDGALVAAGTHNTVSTNSRAEIHVVNVNADGNLCVTRDEVEVMRFEVLNGRNVMLDSTDLAGQQRITQISGSGTFDDGDSLCFIISSKEFLCWVPLESCVLSNSAGRLLSHEERRHLETSQRRRLNPNPGAIQSFIF